jgi:hypothetical protein
MMKLDKLKVFAWGLGLDPERITLREALAKTHRFLMDAEAIQTETLVGR